MTALEEVDPADEPRSFRRKPGWQRAIVLVAGSFMHFALAFVLLFILADRHRDARAPTPRSARSPSACPASAKALDSGARARPGQRHVARPRRPGIKPGDKIISIAGQAGAQLDQLGTVHQGPARRASRSRSWWTGTAETLHLTVTPARVPGRHGPYLGIERRPVFQRASPLGAVAFAGLARSARS